MDDKKRKTEIRKLETDKLREELENVKKSEEGFKQKYLRALADYQNLEKRTQLEKERITNRAAEQIINELLGVLDIIENVQKHHLNDQGIKLAVGNFHSVLGSHGVVKIDVLHKKFDPVEMECTEVVKSDKDDIVVEEVRPGYKLGDTVIRVARVKVGKQEIPNSKIQETNNNQSPNSNNQT